jgi:hypothetical protein
MADPIREAPDRAEVLGGDVVDLGRKFERALDPDRELHHAGGVDQADQIGVQIEIGLLPGNELFADVSFQRFLDVSSGVY